MPSLVERLHKLKPLPLPSWLPNAVAYETEMGSVAYGVSTDASDVDIYGFCVPPARIVFPHTAGVIHGLDRNPERFDQWQEHHIPGFSGESFDVTIFGIVKYVALCMDANPNMIDSLFTPEHCVRHITTAGQIVRDARRLFLHKGAFHKFRGYAHSQLHKIATKSPLAGSKRAANVAEHGFDTKFAYHVVRLYLECEQILEGGDLDLQRDRELLKAIRRGEWTEAQIRDWVATKEKHLEGLYSTSPIPHRPNEKGIKAVLLEALEAAYGQLPKTFHVPGAAESALRQIHDLAGAALGQGAA